MSAPTVLLVEDNPSTRKMLRVTLESHGCRVLEAADGTQALGLLSGTTPDLVVQDLLLPDIAGGTLVGLIRQQVGCADVPVIALSGYARGLEDAHDLGFAERLLKPVEPSALLGAVRRWVPGIGCDASHGTARVLLVDDSPVQRKLTALLLAGEGYVVEEAADGLAALQAARRAHPDLVVADVLMPGLDGFELCRRLQADPETTGVPVVLASSVFVEEGDRRLAAQAGAAAFVTREPDMASLLGAARRALAQAPLQVAQADSFDALHAERLGRALAHQASAHTEQERELARRDAQLAVLAGIAQTLARTTDPATVMEEILARCMEATSVAGAQYHPPAGDGATAAPVTVGVAADVRAVDVADAVRDRGTVVHDDSIVIALRADESDLGVVTLSGHGTPFTPAEVLLCQAVARQLCQAIAIARSHAEVATSRERVIERLALAVDLRDGGTGEHIQRMSRICGELAAELGLDQERCRLLRIASAMHDVGKVATPDAILLKPGKLTAGERAEIERHAEIGHTILSGSGSALLDLAASIAHSHHERWDGGGYPRGLTGEQIPVEGRIAAVADVFDALTSDRPYRPAMPFPDALGIVLAGRGSHFDPAVVDAFERCVTAPAPTYS